MNEVMNHIPFIYKPLNYHTSFTCPGNLEQFRGLISLYYSIGFTIRVDHKFCLNMRTDINELRIITKQNGICQVTKGM